MPKPTTVYLLVDTPDHTRTIQPGQQPTTIACYCCPIQDTVDATIKAAFTALKIPPGSTVAATTNLRVDTYQATVTLEPAPADASPLGSPKPPKAT